MGVKNGKLLPTPLAVSPACQSKSEDNLTTNFRLVVKADIDDDGSLALDFSQDYGKTYYATAVTECPLAYIARAVETDKRALTVETDERALTGRNLFLMVAFVGVPALGF